MTYTDPISVTDCIYFPSYSVKCISCFMRGYLHFKHLKRQQTEKVFVITKNDKVTITALFFYKERKNVTLTLLLKMFRTSNSPILTQ